MDDKDLEIDLYLSAEARNNIIEYAKTAERYEFNNRWYQVSIPIEIVKEITDRIPLTPTAIIFLVSLPYLRIPRHWDSRMAEHGWRTGLCWSMFPDNDKFAPTTLYNPFYTHYYTDKCFIFDTWREHSVVNNSYERSLFQIRYAESPEEIFEVINV